MLLGGVGGALFAFAMLAHADEATIRRNLIARLPDLPNIDEISETPIPGLYEVRLGTDVLYTDEQGNYLIRGAIMDTRSRADLTRARIVKLTAIDFSALPLDEAMLIRQGTGERKLVVFADPNCGFCKRLERELLMLKDVSIYTFLYPILGPDSYQKSKDIWCAKDPAETWRAWMLDGKEPTKAAANCDSSVLERNVAFARKHKVQGTPGLVFEDGSRAPGAVPADQIEQGLQAASKHG
jgi:thiol:disulfide interchange protein DsbC